MKIVNNNQSNYHICYSKNADECTRFSANELQKYIYQSTNCCIPLFSDKCPQRTNEIYIGLARNIYFDESFKTSESFIIKHINNDLIILGGSSRGTMYGVYYFLQKYIGFRKFAIDTEVVKSVDVIDVLEDEMIELPFEYREVYFTDAFNGDYASKNMLNSNLADLSSQKGGRVKWYNFHHSFADLVSPSEYFDTHPEYFSLINGKRIKEHTELCLSNPNVYKLVLAKLNRWIDENPECKIFSIAQDEWMGHFEKMACECPECKKIDEMYQSQSGSIINFVNKLAKEIKKTHPDILIHTFAYQYSRKPPINIKPMDNVIVRLTNIECSWSESIEEGANRNPNGRNALFLNDLIGWSKITNRLYIWDYAVNYRNYLLPFPCLRSMYKNILLYKRIGIKGLLMEGNFSSGGKGYFDELKSYVCAKLMCYNNTSNEISLEEIVDEFCDAFYKEASNDVKNFLYLFENNIKGDIWLYDDSNHEMFTDEIVSKAHDIIYKAISKVKKNTKEYEHVERLLASCEYLEITRMPLENEQRNKLIEEFTERIKKLQITELFERTNLEYSLEIMKKSQYAKERDNWYSLYYIMR